MKFLVLLHILSAIIGVGPVFFYPVLFRKRQSLDELKFSLQMAMKLDYFPKIGGTLAAVSGVVLALIGNYGTFYQLWLVGSLVIYLTIQVIVIGFIAPRVKKLDEWYNSPENQDSNQLPSSIQRTYYSIRSLFISACTLAIVLFIFMILKP